MPALQRRLRAGPTERSTMAATFDWLAWALLASLKGQSIHAVIGGIALPNAESIALHERPGFAKVAHFREVGFKFNRWIDVGYWEKTL